MSTPRPDSQTSGLAYKVAGGNARALGRHSLDRDTPLVALAAARQVVDEASRWLGVVLPDAYAGRLARVARATYARSPSFRGKLLRRRGAEADEREGLYAFMRHWLAARLHEEAPELFARMPAGYAWGGAELPAGVAPVAPTTAGDGGLSVEARMLAAW